MPRLRLRTTLSVLLALAAGIALRLWFIHAFPQIEGDSLLYGDIAKSWMTHGVYGRSILGAGATATVSPTLIRLPGYPGFLALCFAIFGMEHYQAVLYVQLVIDLLTCVLIASYVGKLLGRRAALIALWLAALCPFTANYVAMPLTETLSIFCVALGLYAFAAVSERPRLWQMLALTFACSYAALLRPDGVLLGAVLFPGLILLGGRTPGRRRSLRIASYCALFAALPFAAWTARNWRTFHVFQPLAPRYANDPGEFTPLGYQRWTKTWLIDFASTYEIYWNVPGDDFDSAALPARALDPQDQTRRLIAQYNDGKVFTPQIDAGFAALAAERIHAHPFRYYVTLPVLRLVDMWLRPRVEMLNVELRWWQYDLHNDETEISYAYGALNLAYLIAALIGAFYWPRYRAVMVAYVLLRSVLLVTIEAPEPRYTLECFPIVIAFAAAALSRLRFSPIRRENHGDKLSS